MLRAVKDRTEKDRVEKMSPPYATTVHLLTPAWKDLENSSTSVICKEKGLCLVCGGRRVKSCMSG